MAVLIESKEISEMFKNGPEKYIIPHNSFDNIFSLPNEIRNNVLMEGYFRTYDIDVDLKYLKKRYGDAALVCTVTGENGVQDFEIITADIERNREIIEKDMSLCGYYLAYEEKNKNGQVTMQFEPRFQNKINEIVHQKQYIYHLTPTVNVGKIMMYGLTPKTKNKKFQYPSRVYFFLNKPNKQTCKSLIRQFNGFSSMHFNDYTLLKVEVKQVQDCNFYYDINAQDCVYTKENIPKQAISIDCELTDLE